MSIAQAVFLLERGQTDRQTNKQTDATECYTDAGGYTAGVGNDIVKSVVCPWTIVEVDATQFMLDAESFIERSADHTTTVGTCT